MYLQLKQPNTSIKTNTGWCLWLVQEVYSVPHLYSSAWEAWLATGFKHYERTMTNVSVPCYFEHWGSYGTPPTYGNWGHIVAYVPGVGFVSSPANGYGQNIYQSLEQIERTFNCKYVGWSEDLSGKLIVSKEEEMVTENELRAMFRAFRGREPNSTEIKNYVNNVSYSSMVQSLDSGDERKATGIALDTGKLAINDKWSDQINGLLIVNKDLKTQLATCKSTVLPTGNTVDTEMTKDTNTKVNKILEVVNNIWSFITGIFVKK